MRDVVISLNRLVSIFSAVTIARLRHYESEFNLRIIMDQFILELYHLWSVLNDEDKSQINNYKATDPIYAEFTLEDLLLCIFAHTPGIVFLPHVYERVIANDFMHCIPFLDDSIRKVIEAHPDLFLSEQERSSVPTGYSSRFLPAASDVDFPVFADQSSTSDDEVQNNPTQ